VSVALCQRRRAVGSSFEPTPDEMAAIDALDTGRRGGPEPEAITLEAFGREIPEAR
jgi:2,5-diketo-D-gluconate reductase A